MNSARGIAVSPNGDIGIASYYTQQVCVYGGDGRYQFSLDTKQGLDHGMKSTPVNVTVNAEGVWYVTNKTPYVIMYSPQGVYKSRWLTVFPDNKPSGNTENTSLRGLTIDSNGQLLVGQGMGPVMYISRHREDGSHTTSFQVDIVPYYLAATSHDTIVISSGASSESVEIVDSTGHVLHTLNANRQLPFWHPQGVCCYNDLIVVCNSDWKNTHETSCFSVSAEYMGSIAVCEWPRCVAIAKANCKLLVSCRDVEKVLVYVNKMVIL